MNPIDTAAGTIVSTRQTALSLLPSAAFVATDLNPPMLDHAGGVDGRIQAPVVSIEG